MLKMAYVKMHVNISLMLMDRLGREILLALGTEVLHRERLHLKAPGWLSDISALLTKKLLMLLSPLKDTSDGNEKFWLVSRPFCRILEFLRMIFYLC